MPSNPKRGSSGDVEPRSVASRGLFDWVYAGATCRAYDWSLAHDG